MSSILSGLETRKIRRVVWWHSLSHPLSFTVGEDGVTRIEPYDDSGQMGMVPWLAIYSGDDIMARGDASGAIIYYQETHHD